MTAWDQPRVKSLCMRLWKTIARMKQDIAVSLLGLMLLNNLLNHCVHI